MKKIIIPALVLSGLIFFAFLAFNSATTPSKNREGLIEKQEEARQDSINLPSKYLGKFEP